MPMRSKTAQDMTCVIPVRIPVQEKSYLKQLTVNIFGINSAGKQKAMFCI